MSGYWQNGTYQFTNRDGGDLKIGNLWQDWTGISNVNKSLETQVLENEKNREYNLKLAREQNAANIAQWNRENAYNSPSAQKSRLVAAGLNPDMMYGGSGVMNTAAASPPMTSGAPSTPVDWSSLASKPTLGQSIAQGLQIAQARANIDATKASTRKTLAEAGLSETSLEYADAREKIGLKISEAEFNKVSADYELALKAIEKAPLEIENLSLDVAYKGVQRAFESEVFQAQIDLMAEELKIKKEEAKNAVAYYAAQLLGLQADNAWKDAAWIVERANGVPTLIKYGAELTPKLLDMLLDFVPKPLKKGVKGVKK